MDPDNYECPSAICTRLEASGEYLKIDGLEKTYPGGFQAVKGVNIKMFDS